MTPTHSSQDPRPAMKHAIDDAIKALATSSNKGEKREYFIRQGEQKTYGERHRYRYEFTLDDPVHWDVEDGTELDLVALDGSGSSAGRLVATKEAIITISTEMSLPAAILEQAQVVPKPDMLLQRLREALDRVPEHPNHLGLALFGAANCQEGEASSLPHLKRFQPDSAQALAFRRGLASELLVMVGPPGTGKSDLVAALALTHQQRGHRVLILSHTNIAIDNAVVRLVDFYQQEGLGTFLERYGLIRQGTPQLTILEEEAYQTITLPLIIAIEQEQLQEQHEILLEELKLLPLEIEQRQQAHDQALRTWPAQRTRLVQSLDAYRQKRAALEEQEWERVRMLNRQLQDLHSRVTQIERDTEDIVSAWQAMAARQDQLQTQINTQTQTYERYRQQIQEMQQWHPLHQFLHFVFRGESITALQANLEETYSHWTTLTREQAGLEQPMQAYQRRYTAALTSRDNLLRQAQAVEQERDDTSDEAREIAQLKGWESDVTGQIAQNEQALQQQEAELAALREQVKGKTAELMALEKEIKTLAKRLEEQLIAEAQIVAATLTSAYLNHSLLYGRWDVVIVDEGSMAPPPALVVAGALAAKHFIVIGDPYQLGPIFKFEKEAPRGKIWLGTDFFTLANYTLEEIAAETHHSALLRQQGRMHPEISFLVKRPIYNGLLEDREHVDPSWADKVPRIGPMEEQVVLVCDTSGSSARLERRRREDSPHNPFHAQCAIRLAQLVSASLPEPVREEQIGLITPYTRQRNEIRELVYTQHPSLARQLRIGTVHAFQGLQFDAVIFDTTVSPSSEMLSHSWPSIFTSNERLITVYLEGLGKRQIPAPATRLLNVAISRAKYKLIFIANMAHIRAAPRSHLLPTILEIAYEKGHLSWKELFELPLPER
jgi:energy-coupling factor transporter ATP-binding protein EcfA2